MNEQKYTEKNSVLKDTKNYLKEELYSLIQNDTLIFEFIQEGALDGLWFWDLDEPDNVWMNPKYWTTLGYDPEKMPHKTHAWQAIIFEEDLKNVYANFASHAKDPSCPYDQIVRFRHKLGHTVWIRCRGMMLRNEKGVPVKMLGAHTDITDIKKREEEIKVQSAFFEHIIDGTDLGTWKWNAQTGETVFGERWAGIIGYSLDELAPVSIDTWYKYAHSEDVEKSNLCLKEHFEGKTSIYECEVRMKHKRGDYVWVLTKGKVVSWNDQGDPEWMIGSHQEITEKKNTFEKNRLFIEQAPSAIAMFDTDMIYLAASQQWYDDYGIEDKNVVGKSHYEVFPEIGERWKADHQKCLSGKVLKSDEDRFERQDGRVQWLTWELRPWYTNDNKVGGILMHTADITRVKEAEINLRISEEIFRRNFENAAIGMAMLNEKGAFTNVNYKLCEMLGYSNEELINLTLNDVIHAEDIKQCTEIRQMLFSGRRSYSNTENKCVHRNGNIIHVNFSISLVKDIKDQPSYCIAQIADISHKILARQKSEDAISKLEHIIDNINQVSIIGTDKNGIINIFNKGAENLLGYTKEEILFEESFELLYQKEEIAQREEELSEMLGYPVKGFHVFTELPDNEQYDTRDWMHVRKDGTSFPVLLTLSAIRDDYEITGYLAVATNITEIKKSEKELKSLLMVAEDQNRRLKNFAHIVSHNLKSHSGNFEMLLELFIQDNPQFEDNEIIMLFKTASEHLSETILHLNEVVLMNTSVDENLVKVNLWDVAHKTIESVAAIATEAHVIVNNKISKEVNVLGIPAYLDSILLNFITNGIKYRGDKKDSYVTLTSNVNQDFVELIIEDNGLGIDLIKHRSKLFGMYKTFHNNKEARGIGLFITKNQVEAMGGTIEVESKVNQGTTFKIYFKYEKN